MIIFHQQLLLIQRALQIFVKARYIFFQSKNELSYVNNLMKVPHNIGGGQSMNEKYIINLATSALISYFDNGYEYTQVIEGDDIFIIRQSPDDIVKASFLYMGSSVEGAIESARLILKKRYMLPIGLSVKHNIFLIRCHAKCKPGTVWLVNSHIEDTLPNPANEKKTIVYTKDGHSLTIETKSGMAPNKAKSSLFST